MLKFKNVNWPKLHQAILRDYPLTNVAKKYGPGTYVDWNYATGFSNITSKFKPSDPQLLLRGLNTTYQMLKDYENVLVAGKNVGASAQAYGSVRIMPNTALAAETIGIILGHELKHKRLKQLTPADFKRIHMYLADEHRIKIRG